MRKINLTFFTCAKWLSQFWRGVKKNLFLYYVGELFNTLVSVVNPILLGIMLNKIVYHKDIRSFLLTSIVFFGVIILACIICYFTYEQYSLFWNEYTDNVRVTLFEKIQNSTAQKMMDANYGDIISMLQWQTSELAMFYTHVIIGSITSIVFSGLAVFMIFRLSILIGVIVMLSIPTTFLVSGKLGKNLRKCRRKNRKAYTFYVGWLFDFVNSLLDIVLLCAEEHVNKVFKSILGNLIDSDMKAKKMSVKSTALIQGVQLVLQMFMFVVMAFLTYKHVLLIGSIVVILSYYTSLKSKIENITSNYMWAQGQIEIVQKYFDCLENDDEKVWIGTEKLPNIKGKINFSNVSFSYNQSIDILNKFCLEINAGEKIALVGESGCGKTTLAYMLIGFFQPDEGEIYIDDRDIKDYSLQSLRNKIGVVQQEVLLFPNSIRENILLGNKNATDDDIMIACRMAGIEEFIKTLEDGLDTMVGKGGRQLSGGQKQRLSIARIYLRNPQIIVFDEATSALDNETERIIHLSWQQVLENRTSIIITHRLSSVLMCDRVALMEHGNIIEMGAPGTLAKMSERFQKLFAIEEQSKSAD